MADTAARFAAAALGLTFAWAAVAKLVNFRAWGASLEAYGLPAAVVRGATVGVPVVEFAAAALLLVLDVRLGAALSLAIIAAFSLALARAHALQGDKLPCGCFGRSKARDFRMLLARNAVLGALAAVVLALGSGAGPEAVETPRPGEIVPAALATIGVLLLAWMLWQARTGLGRGRR